MEDEGKVYVITDENKNMHLFTDICHSILGSIAPVICFISCCSAII